MWRDAVPRNVEVLGRSVKHVAHGWGSKVFILINKIFIRLDFVYINCVLLTLKRPPYYLVVLCILQTFQGNRAH